ncbi:hypothetical protein ABZ479_18305 [Streptomyces sp. NPDC005722]
MHRFGYRRAAAAVAAAAAGILLATAPAPASATTGPVAAGAGDSGCATAGSLCVYETEWFTGRSALYREVDAGCVTAPFGILANINMTDRAVTFYKNTDCTGPSTTEPAGNLHSWKSLGPMFSFRA